MTVSTVSTPESRMLLRSVQSVLHKTVSRAAADSLGEKIVEFVIENYSDAVAEYGTNDPLTLGEMIARDFVRQSVNK